MDSRGVSGGVVHVTYEILKRMGKTNDCFTPSDIVDSYKKFINDPKIIEIRQKFAKKEKGEKGVLSTLEDYSNYQKFLNKHLHKPSKKKGLQCFEKCDRNRYRLRKECIEILEHERKIKNIDC